MKKTLWMVLSLMIISSMILTACGSVAPAPETPAEEVFETISREKFMALDIDETNGESQRCGENGFLSYYEDLGVLSIKGVWLLDEELFEEGQYQVGTDFDTNRLVCTEAPDEAMPTEEALERSVVEFNEIDVATYQKGIAGFNDGRIVLCGNGWITYQPEVKFLSVVGTEFLFDGIPIESNTYKVSFEGDQNLLDHISCKEQGPRTFLINQINEETFNQNHTGFPQGLCETTTWYPNSEHLVVMNEEVYLGIMNETLTEGFYHISGASTSDIKCK